ncbi:MAG: peptidoglycan-binding domain-containing protein, partial [Lysobacterales bacterium]
PGIYCLESVGSLERLRRLGAPVLVTVEMADAPRHLLLIAIEDEVLTFAATSGLSLVSRAAFEQRWLGEFRAVWRIPDRLPARLALGARGASVDWLEHALAAADIAPDATHAAGVYDAALADAVRTLQRRFGLREDGVVGRETQWVLASRLASAGGAFADLPTRFDLSDLPPRPLDSQPLRSP